MGQLQKVSWRTVGYTALGTVLAAASVVAVVNSDGVHPTSLTSNAASRWLVDRVSGTVVLVDGLAGRVVAKIKTESVTSDEVAVQGAGGAFLVATGQGSLRTISTSKLQLGTAQPVSQLLDTKAKLGVGASGLTILRAAAGEASVVAVGDVTRPIKIPKSDDSSLIAADGSMWLLTDKDATHVNVDETRRTVPLRGASSAATTTIGSRAVAFDSKASTVRWLDGGDVTLRSIPNASEAVLQQPGDDAPCVWLGVGNTLVCVGATGIDLTLPITGMDIGPNDKLAVAGTAAVIVTPTNDVTRIDMEHRTVVVGDQPTVRANADLDISASGNLIWLDDRTGDSAWVVHRFGINPINKADTKAPLLDAQGQVAIQGEAGPGPASGGGDNSLGEDQSDKLDHNGHDDPPHAVDDSVTARAGATVTIPVTGNDYDPDGEAIAVRDVGTIKTAGHGTVDVLNGTSVSYVPEFGFSGLDSFDYTIVDEHGNTDTATVAVQLFPPGSPNQPPIARDERVKTGLGKAITIDVLANDIDPERDALTVSTFRQNAGQVAQIKDTIGPTGLPALRYQPPGNEPGIFTFEYKAADPQGGVSQKATVTVEVTNSPNTAPTAFPDAIRLRVGAEDDVDVKANDVDPDGDDLRLTGVTNPRGVNAVVKGQQLHITLQPGAENISSVRYTINDGDPTHEATGTVLVLKIGDSSPNRPPVANPDSDRVVVGNTIKIPVTANDVDPDGDQIRLLTVGEASEGGGSTLVEGNSVRFTPALPDITEPTPVTFSYTITDGNRHEVTGRVTVTVLVEALPAAPFARDDFADTVKDKAVNIDVLANDSDPSGGKPSLIGLPVCPNGGETTKTTDNRVTFTPPAGLIGTFRCSYQVSNTQGLVAGASIIVTVTEAPAGNRPPEIIPAALQKTVKIGGSLTINAGETATDPDSDVLVFSSVNKPANGNVVFNAGSSSFTYQAPAAGSADKTPDATEVEFTISDGHDNNIRNKFSIKLVDDTVVPGAPAAKPSTIEIVRAAVAGDTVPVDVVGELRDRNVGSVLTLTGVSLDSGPALTPQVLNGAATNIVTTGAGTVVVTYTVTNAAGGVASDKIRIVVSEPQPNAAPVAVDDVLTISSGGRNSVNLLANDSGISDPGDKVTVELKNRPPSSFGSVVVDNGILTFVAQPDAIPGTATLVYTLGDGSGQTDDAQVTLTLLPCSESPPSARNDSTFTPYMTPINIDLTKLVDSGVIVPSSVSGAGLTGPTGTYTPPAGMNGVEKVKFTVVNGCQQTAQGQLSIQVNRSPQAGPVSRSASAGTEILLSVGDLASDDEPLSIISMSGNPTWATLRHVGGVPSPDTQIRIAPNSGAKGQFTFTYTVQDPGGLTGVSTITVTVTNQPPNAVADAYAAPSSTFEFNPTTNDSDPEGGPLVIQTYDLISSPDSRDPVVSVVGNVFHVQLATGVTTISYTIRDDVGLTDTATVTITLAPPNSPPVVPDLTAAANGQKTLHLSMDVTDPDGDVVTMRCVAPPGNFVFSPADPSTGPGSADPTLTRFNLDVSLADPAANTVFTCTGTDSHGASDSGTLTITP